EQSPGVGGIDDTIVPKAGARVIGMALALVLLADRLLEGFLFLLRGKSALHGGEHACSLLAAHDRNARVRPHPQEARRIGAAAHAVVAGAEGAAEDHGELG